MLILGLTSFKHDTAAALFEDGVLQAAIENDKLTRSKSSGVPEDAIRFCLEKILRNNELLNLCRTLDYLHDLGVTEISVDWRFAAASERL